MTFHPTLDLVTLRQRLITKEGQNLQATRGSLSKCALRMLEFTKATQAAAQDPDDKTIVLELQSVGNELMRELKLHDLEIKKMALGTQAAEAELQYYDYIREETQGSIAEIRSDIEKLRVDLELEMKIRKNRQEYEALAKTASNRSSSKISKRKLAEEQKDIHDLKNEGHKIQKKLEVKGRQFHLLMQSIADLKRGIEEEELQGNIEQEVRDKEHSCIGDRPSHELKEGAESSS